MTLQVCYATANWVVDNGQSVLMGSSLGLATLGAIGYRIKTRKDKYRLERDN